MHSRFILLFLSILATAAASQAVEQAGQLALEPAGNGFQLKLSAPPLPPVGGTHFRFRLEASENLGNWSPKGELTSLDDDVPSLAIENAAGHQFFRVRPALEDADSEPDGAELFGYDRVFKEELKAAGFLTPAEFAAQQQEHQAGFLARLSFDPTTAQYWDAFNADPAVVNASLPPGSLDKRLYDFRLTTNELAIFQTNGFVVSERLGSATVADVFYRVFSDDFPVFISADALLHAWHFSYQRLLEEAEETQLAPALQQVLEGMHAQLGLLTGPVLQGPLTNSVLDADYYLTVARSLLTGQQVDPMIGGDSMRSTVTNTLKAVAALQLTDFEMFGEERIVDFSQFQIRGHYERSPNLGRYFQAFMWTSRIDFRILSASTNAQSLRNLGTAIVLSDLLQASGNAETWRQLDEVLRLFTGRVDAMTFAQFSPLLTAGGADSLAAITSLQQLVELNQQIVQGQLGLQWIPADVYESPFGTNQLQLPRSFVLTGQRFNPDGWALGQVIFDRIKWNEEIPGYTFFGKVIRRYASALDMAYAVLGNRSVGPGIAERMLDVGSRSGFRDGLPYAHNLTALARTFERMSEASWEDSVVVRWLRALRELSAPTTDARFPEAMRTQAWAMRTLNSQLASYTELKHDTVLYAKQPYTSIILCQYPAGFVEPVPLFWQRLKEMAEALGDGLQRLPATGQISISDPMNPWQPIVVDLAQRQAARLSFCANFAQQAETLQTLAAKELQQQPFTDTETSFIRGLMNRQDHPYEGPTFDGWYPGLFYKDYGQALPGPDSNGSNKPDPLVTDVQTAPPDDIDPQGGVLHEGTGNVDFLLIAIDNGPDRMVYAGPVLSHYEFVVPGPALKRLTDSEWAGNFPAYSWQPAGSPPPRPEWTRSYLVPK
jgi:hypothetical protein